MLDKVTTLGIQDQTDHEIIADGNYQAKSVKVCSAATINGTIIVLSLEGQAMSILLKTRIQTIRFGSIRIKLNVFRRRLTRGKSL